MQLILSWTRYLDLLTEILTWLEHNRMKPDAVVGIARGGLVPATMLSQFFQTRMLGIVYIQKTVSDEPFSKMLPLAVCQGFYCPSQLEGKSVLIVDCIIQTGQTMRCAISKVKDMRPSGITAISICTHKNVSGLDYFSPLTVEPDDWVTFPWEFSPSHQSL